MLIDTDVIVWCLRGNQKAVKALSVLPHKVISQITRMELISGCRSKTEINLLRRFLADENFTISPLTQEIGIRADLWLEQKNLSHGIGLADSLIAATASSLGLPLFTGNAKHFRCFEQLEIKKFTP
jgi:predicted nucleic acid-binding protein